MFIRAFIAVSLVLGATSQVQACMCVYRGPMCRGIVPMAEEVRSVFVGRVVAVLPLPKGSALMT